MSKGPVEIKTKNGHPGEHGHGSKVHWVADGQTSSERDANEELVVKSGQGVAVGFQLNVEAGDEEDRGEEYEEYVDGNDFSLKQRQSSWDFKFYEDDQGFK